MEFGLTKDGFKRKLYSDIELDLFTRAKDLFGEDINLSERSPLGIFLRIIAWSLALIWQLAEHIYHQSHLPTAEGISLDYVAEKADIYRFPALKSHGQVKITGTPNKRIYKGFKVSTVDKIIFETDKEYVIDSDGTALCDVICTQLGEIGNVQATSINTIVNPEIDVVSVSNEFRFSNGREIETDDELRDRYKTSFIDSGKATINAIINHLLKIPTLKGYKVLENDTMQVVNDMQPKSIKVIALGGSDEEVANAILDSKAAGIETNGNVSVQVKDNQGISHTIKFSRATEVLIYIDVTLSYISETIDKETVKAKLKKRLQAYIKNVGMGNAVIVSQLISTILSDTAIKDASVKIGKTQDELSADNIKLLDEQVPTVIASNIIISEVQA